MIPFLTFLAGLAALVAGAELLVRGASRLALSFGISPLVVGLTIVAFGTSAPEMAVSVGGGAQWPDGVGHGQCGGQQYLQRAVHSGPERLDYTLVVHVQLIRQEVPIMIGASLLVLVLALDGTLGLFDGALLFGLLLAYTGFLVVQSRRASREAQAEFDAEIQPASPGAWDARLPVQLALIAAGLALLVFGSGWLVSAAVFFAQSLGVSDLVIGLTIVAAGTSMPEVATSIMAALKGERDIAVGNVVGSCTFNLLGCLGLSGLLAGLLPGSPGLTVASSLLALDIWVMLAVALACLPIFLSGREIARWEGAVFLGYYVAYMAYVVLAAQQHAVLGPFSAVMMGFVVPITVVTLVVSLLRRPAHTT